MNLRENIWILSAILLFLVIDFIFVASFSSRYFPKLKIQSFPEFYRVNGIIIAYIFTGIILFLSKEMKGPVSASLLGLSVWGIYDFTNWATIENWTLTFSILDSIWGSFLVTMFHFVINSKNLFGLKF